MTLAIGLSDKAWEACRIHATNHCLLVSIISKISAFICYITKNIMV